MRYSEPLKDEQISKDKLICDNAFQIHIGIFFSKSYPQGGGRFLRANLHIPKTHLHHFECVSVRIINYIGFLHLVTRSLGYPVPSRVLAEVVFPNWKDSLRTSYFSLSFLFPRSEKWKVCWCCESREYIIQKPTSEKITNIKKLKIKFE